MVLKNVSYNYVLLYDCCIILRNKYLFNRRIAFIILIVIYYILFYFTKKFDGKNKVVD